MNKKISEKLSKIVTELQNSHLERGEVVRAMMLSALAKQNMFLLGPPGTGKSYLAHDFCSRIDSAQYFYYLLGKSTTSEELFGVLSLAALEKGKYERIIDGKLPTAHVAFLDEVFKGSTQINNSMLAVMNEKVYHNGNTLVKCPLLSVFAASNELPVEGDGLAAVYDRFLIRAQVNYLADEDNLASLLMGSNGKGDVHTTITLEELAEAQRAVEAVEITNDVAQLVLELRRLVKADGKIPQSSDRRFKQSLSLLKASAVLDGRTRINDEDLTIFNYILWDQPEQIKDVKRIVGKVASPVMTKISAIEDSLEEILARLQETGSGQYAAIEASKQVVSLKESLDQLVSKSKTNSPRVVEAQERFYTKYKAILSKQLKDALAEAK